VTSPAESLASCRWDVACGGFRCAAEFFVVSWVVARLDGIDGVFRRVGRCLARVSTFHRAAGRRARRHISSVVWLDVAGRACCHLWNLPSCRGTLPDTSSEESPVVPWDVGARPHMRSTEKRPTALSPVLLRSLAIQIFVILRASNITPKGNPIQMY
jgi:hypothetical protein